MITRIASIKTYETIGVIPLLGIKNKKKVGYINIPRNKGVWFVDLKHIAFIPDGNRRYAKKAGIDYAKAYETGFNKAKELIVDWREYLQGVGVDQLTLWALSTENLRRNRFELEIIFNYMKKALSQAIESGEDYGSRFRFVGNLSLIPKDIQELMRKFEDMTQDNKGFQVNIAVGYGGKDELINAFKALASRGLDFTEENLKKFLYIPSYPDLIVRTSGTIRTSGFMPWQAAYSEWYFSPKLWPEFELDDLKLAVNDYFSRKRNFGK